MQQPSRIPQSPSEYLRARLKSECKTRGRAAQIADATGFTKGHISNVLKGKTEIGGNFALALLKLWNLDYAELARAEEAAGPSAAAKLPNLEATLQFCLGDFPKAFLDRYAAGARNQSWDRTKRAWFKEIEARYAEWEEQPAKASKVPRARHVRARGEPSGIITKVRGSVVRANRAKAG
jgi:transcriptional regulator with XRE-family HTH domain